MYYNQYKINEAKNGENITIFSALSDFKEKMITPLFTLALCLISNNKENVSIDR